MDLAWECECGNVEYGSIAPEECEKCFKIGGFAQLPDELIEERSKESDEMDSDKTVKKAKSVKAKNAKPAKRKRK